MMGFKFRLQRLVLLLPLIPLQVNGTDTGLILENPGSFNPVGSGARALGMGGAFIPVADDATAASWNPAGLVQLRKPEFSIVGDWGKRKEDNTFNLQPEGSNEASVDNTRLNYFSLSLPFGGEGSLWPGLGRNMIVSVNYQSMFEFGREWHFGLPDPFPGNTLDYKEHYDYKQSGSIYALGFAYAVEITTELSLGATINIWEDIFQHNGWEQRYHREDRGTILLTNGSRSPFSYIEDRYHKVDFSGLNFNFGLLWQMTPSLSLGAVVKTPFDADLTYTTTTSSNWGTPSSSSAAKTLKMPLSYGLGLAYRHSDQLTVAADVYRTEWSRFALVDANGAATSPISGKDLAQTAGIDDTLWLRAGGEYLFMSEELIIPLRAGVFYDPAPAEGDPDEFYGFTLGSGIIYGDGSGDDRTDLFAFDVAYQYRIGKGIGEDSIPLVGLSQDVVEHRIYSSLIVYLP